MTDTAHGRAVETHSDFDSQSTYACNECGFTLWRPVHALPHSLVGLYDDARFPGRCIVSFIDHADRFEDLPPDSVLSFVMDVNKVARAVMKSTGCDRVNIAIMGNAVSHVHAHIIPRYAGQEQYPKKSPWNDPRPVMHLTPGDITAICQSISSELTAIHPRRRSAKSFFTDTTLPLF